MSGDRLALLGLLVAGAVLGALAFFARERSYRVPEKPLPESIPIAIEGEAPDGYAIRTFAVEGICCQGCSSKLHGALLAVEGVRAAAVDPLRKEASALARADVTDERLAAALTFDKYSARPR